MMWSAVAPADIDSPAPSARSKHSATLIGEHVYLLGGRNGNLPMKDFWKYNLVAGKWQQLKPSGDKLPSLQEHSAVVYKENIYVFGGEVGFSAGTETPLWCYDIRNNCWRKIKSKKGVTTPKGRRGHTALVHRGAMLIYGGYQDLRGSCSELWAFHFESESWHLISNPPKSGNYENFPPPRHKHSAIIHDDHIWIYGGMSDLQERSDMWKFDLLTKTWTSIKTKINPGPLNSHACCKLPSSMLIFGGERNGHALNELWKFNFSTETWERITISGTKPQPRSESIAFAVSELSLSSLNDQNSLENKTIRIRSRTCTSADRGSRHSSYLPNNRVAPCERTYIFQPSQQNYTDGSDIAQQYSENLNKASRSFLQEITKLSQISRLNNKCSYTVLSGCTTDSTESLLKQHASPQSNSDNNEIIDFTLDTDVASNRNTLVKSRSAYVIKKRSPTDENSALKEKKKVEFENLTNERKRITRDPISVPNFTTLNLPTPALTPVEAAKLVYLDTDDENDLIGDNQQSQPITQVKRGESYSSHLAYADNPLYQHMINQNNVKFVGDLPEKSEGNVSSTSDYASIETMNRLSSASNYSVKTNTPQDDPKINKDRDKDGPFGFCNPNYLLNNNEHQDRKNLIRLLARPELHNSDENLLELQNFNGIISKNTTKVYYRQTRKHPPRFLSLDHEESPRQQQKARSKDTKYHRALSASRAESQRRYNDQDFDRLIDPFVPLYVYVIGGKEQGQVTVFQRPISIWKLKLF